MTKWHRGMLNLDRLVEVECIPFFWRGAGRGEGEMEADRGEGT